MHCVSHELTRSSGSLPLSQSVFGFSFKVFVCLCVLSQQVLPEDDRGIQRRLAVLHTGRHSLNATVKIGLKEKGKRVPVHRILHHHAMRRAHVYTVSPPFQHITQINHESPLHVGHLHPLGPPLPLLFGQNLQTPNPVCQQNCQHAVVGVLTRPQHPLLHVGLLWGVVKGTQPSHARSKFGVEEVRLYLERPGHQPEESVS
mmetsp:Transcript_52350/g.102469  ORF Transcript_52350/g.102469 Transcript_52350/m.102469 type:complete len:201 (+) Transcript_52350:126-728(+)